MWNGKNKALTFSYDDGTMQDVRLIELFNKYGMKATFNINSGLLGTERTLIRENVEVLHNKINPEDVKFVYDGHEVAAHTLTHPSLPKQEKDEEIIRQVEEDRAKLSVLTVATGEGMCSLFCELGADGVISGGMIPKVECCIKALDEGVKNVTILDGRIPHSVLMELLTDEGAGTMVTRDEE